MTLPASGSISLSQVNVELGLPANAQISLTDAAVRTLAGVPSGPISLSNLYGKSSQFTVNATSASNSELSTSNGTVTCFPSVSVSGGSGSFSYAWSFTSNPNNCALLDSTLATCRVSHSYTSHSNGSANAVLQCIVTDSTNGKTVTATGITATVSWEWS